MAPCASLPLPQHAILKVLGSRTYRKSGISKLDLTALCASLDLPQSIIRNEIDEMVDDELLEVTEEGFRPVVKCSCISTHPKMGRLLLNQKGDFQGETQSNEKVRPPAVPSPESSGVGSLAAAVKSVKNDSSISRFKRIETWNAMDLAKFFGRETTWKLRVTPPNHAALARQIKALLTAGTTPVEVHRMILIFVAVHQHQNFHQPAWRIFYKERDMLLSRARRKLRALHYEEDVEEEERPQLPERARVRRDFSWLKVGANA